MLPSNDIRWYSEPVELNWLGWRTDTATLASCGWDLSADQDVYNNMITIALRYRHNGNYGVRGISRAERFHYNTPPVRGMRQQMQSVNLELAHEIHMQGFNSPEFSAIDASPSYATMGRIQSIDDFAHFKKIHNDTPEIILQRASMDEVLQFALQKQETRQVEIREEMMRRRDMEQYKQHSELKAQLRLAA